MEIWKDIKGYEGFYRVSNTGKVLSLRYMGGYQTRELKVRRHKRGYLWVSLRKYGKEGHYLIHRLVAEAFIENPNNYKFVNHKDENPTNNNVQNLEWCTHKYNVNYSMKRHPERANSSYKEIRKIRQFSRDGKLIKEYENILVASKEIGCRTSNIRNCCNHKRKTAYGYRWEYVI